MNLKLFKEPVLSEFSLLALCQTRKNHFSLSEKRGFFNVVFHGSVGSEMFRHNYLFPHSGSSKIGARAKTVAEAGARHAASTSTSFPGPFPWLEVGPPPSQGKGPGALSFRGVPPIKNNLRVSDIRSFPIQ